MFRHHQTASFFQANFSFFFFFLIFQLLLEAISFPSALLTLV